MMSILTNDLEATHLFKYLAEFEIVRKQSSQSFVKFIYNETQEEKFRLLQRIANIYKQYTFSMTIGETAFVYREKAAI